MQQEMPTKDDLLKLIPVGEENAVSSRLLWQQLGMWSLASIKKRLIEMAAAGLIARKQLARRETNQLVFQAPRPGRPLVEGKEMNELEPRHPSSGSGLRRRYWLWR